MAINADLKIETIIHPADEITQVIERGLHEHNLSVLGREVIYNYAKIAVVARDDRGQIAGGLIALYLWGALKIDVLWVAAEQRGGDIGTRLMQGAEAEALARGVTLMYLETTSFQARAFYEKLGFEVYGQLDDYPKGHTWYHMRKRLPVGE